MLYKAAIGMSQPKESGILFDGSTLSIQGALLDSISKSVLEMPKGTFELSNSQWLIDVLIPWIKTTRDALTDTAIYKEIPYQGFQLPIVEDIRDTLGDPSVQKDLARQTSEVIAILRTAVADRRKPMPWTQVPSRRLNQVEDAIALSEISASILTNKAPNHMSKAASESINELRNDGFFLLWRMFVTENGYLGLTRLGVQTGDIVCLFPNASTPYVLHPFEVNENGTVQNYRLVGDAYVHGIMDGEYTPSDAAYRVFDIV
ncbi:uncharacterized protein KY384_004640 [Bacidia gigantensis]|uniref:uncharacterized protein n=1 Tax=Bacidia gigantensis TaxID=2732470 RepID=UPI001D05543F|nr:uncharacterized protein KY384_004640 [Bacidia gigantensis]KAG8530602.1 hypothetical protein KY384_004640 [Bacidia gigantensis]